MANDVACELFFSEGFNALAGEQVGLTKRSSRGFPRADFLRITEATVYQGHGGLHDHRPYQLSLICFCPSSTASPSHHSNTSWKSGIACVRSAKFPSRTRAQSSSRIVFSKMADAGDKLQLTEKQISSEARNLTVARTDTAAIALTYLVWAVLNYLHVKQKLQAELDQHCPADPMGKELET
jgi:hypothetical protein